MIQRLNDAFIGWSVRYYTTETNSHIHNPQKKSSISSTNTPNNMLLNLKVCKMIKYECALGVRSSAVACVA